MTQSKKITGLPRSLRVGLCEDKAFFLSVLQSAVQQVQEAEIDETLCRPRKGERTSNRLAIGALSSGQEGRVEALTRSAAPSGTPQHGGFWTLSAQGGGLRVASAEAGDVELTNSPFVSGSARLRRGGFFCQRHGEDPKLPTHQGQIPLILGGSYVRTCYVKVSEHCA